MINLAAKVAFPSSSRGFLISDERKSDYVVAFKIYFSENKLKNLDSNILDKDVTCLIKMQD